MKSDKFIIRLTKNISVLTLWSIMIILVLGIFMTIYAYIFMSFRIPIVKAFNFLRTA
jgi:H+/Cl- antiporter ClcA